jgi:nucleoside-diphosphate-sugar epimerase
MRSNLGMIFKFIENSLPFFIFDDELDMKKSFLSVNNINNIIKMTIFNDSYYNEIFNLSDHEPISLSSMICSYKKITNSKSILINISKKKFYILRNIPILNSIIKKVFGNFVLDNSKINSFYDEKLLDTHKGIKNYIETKI